MKFTSSRSLAFCGHKGVFDSSDDDNCLVILEQIAEYEPFLCYYIGKKVIKTKEMLCNNL